MTRASDFQVALAACRGGNKAPRIIIRGYVPPNTDDDDDAALIGTTLRGMTPFQYDPNSDGHRKKAWRLLMEKTDFFADK